MAPGGSETNQGERNFHVLYELVAGATALGMAKDLRVGVFSSTERGADCGHDDRVLA